MNQRMILDEAVKLMNMGDVDNAERLLLQAREESGDLDFYVLNNLGAVYLMK
jgi:Flp pilus assembly protein TadD